MIGFIYIVLFFAIAYSFYSLIKPKATCQDGIKNQLEENIDCGGPCAPCDETHEIEDFIIEKIEWVDTATNKFDTVVTIKNPNSLFGASTLRYKLKYFDQVGQIIKETAWLKDFILPQEEKYLLVQEIEVPESPAKIEI
ncbi:MAG: hypothetical protein KAQ63_02870, partial [Candidatus Moranbacteria bacterium]|nr:hypothetical protein [Candidatus Moranbacteria bacterium]